MNLFKTIIFFISFAFFSSAYSQEASEQCWNLKFETLNNHSLNSQISSQKICSTIFSNYSHFFRANLISQVSEFKEFFDTQDNLKHYNFEGYSNIFDAKISAYFSIDSIYGFIFIESPNSVENIYISEYK